MRTTVLEKCGWEDQIVVSLTIFELASITSFELLPLSYGRCKLTLTSFVELLRYHYSHYLSLITHCWFKFVSIVTPDESSVTSFCVQRLKAKIDTSWEAILLSNLLEKCVNERQYNHVCQWGHPHRDFMTSMRRFRVIFHECRRNVA